MGGGVLCADAVATPKNTKAKNAKKAMRDFFMASAP
jgi:hypothetical protein